MFKHIYITRIRCTLRDRVNFFWASAFPLLLATLFWFAFGNLNSISSFSSIPLAVVADSGSQQNLPLQSALAGASQGESPLFDLTLASQEEADALLLDGSVKGVLSSQDQSISLNFRSNGLSQSIIKEFADTYLQMNDAIRSLVAQDPLQALALANRGYQQTTIEDASGSAEMDPRSIYFFALLAMACMYGGFQGMTSVWVTQANQSAVAVRNALAPVKRFTVFSASFLAAATVQFISVVVLVFYLTQIIGINFGNRHGLILLVCAAGSLMGVGLGAFISAIFKKKEGLMTATLLSISMVGSFLSGMMISDVKYMVAQNAPILTYINPVNLIADALYSLYLYDSLDRYIINLGLILAFSLFFLVSVSLLMRRHKYASL